MATSAAMAVEIAKLNGWKTKRTDIATDADLDALFTFTRGGSTVTMAVVNAREVERDLFRFVRGNKRDGAVSDPDTLGAIESALLAPVRKARKAKK